MQRVTELRVERKGVTDGGEGRGTNPWPSYGKRRKRRQNPKIEGVECESRDCRKQFGKNVCLVYNQKMHEEEHVLKAQVEQ